MCIHVHVNVHVRPYSHKSLTARSGCVIQVVIIFNNSISDQITTTLKFERFTRRWLNTDAKCQEEGGSMHHMSYANKYMRLFGTGSINIFGLAIVTTTIPVFLCTSKTYMEFVLNAAATIFIVELDDLKSNTTVVISGAGVDEIDHLKQEDEESAVDDHEVRR